MEEIAITEGLAAGDITPVEKFPLFLKNGTNNMVCPKGGRYVIGNIGDPPRCSFHGSIEEMRRQRE